MKALVLNNHEQPFDFQEVVNITPDQKNVVVSLVASALNHRDYWIKQGQYAGIRYPCILGSDGAGWLDGRAVVINPSLHWGKQEHTQGADFSILGLPTDGTFAEAVRVPKENIHDKPAHLTMEQAAALPLAGLTAWRVLYTRCQLKKKERVLVSGIGGGVALFVLQFAVTTGAEVWVTSGSDEKIARAVALGAKGGVNYHSPGWDKQLRQAAGGGFDIVIDSAAGDQLGQLIALCNPGGRLGMYGGTLGKINGLSPQIIFWKQISLYGSTMGSPKEFAQMLRFVGQHEIVPIIDSVYPLAKGNEALAKMASGTQFGKIVLANEL